MGGTSGSRLTFWWRPVTGNKIFDKIIIYSSCTVPRNKRMCELVWHREYPSAVYFGTAQIDAISLTFSLAGRPWTSDPLFRNPSGSFGTTSRNLNFTRSLFECPTQSHLRLETWIYRLEKFLSHWLILSSVKIFHRITFSIHSPRGSRLLSIKSPLS